MDDEESDSMEIEDDSPEFTLAEILEMDSLFKEMGEKPITQEFCEELADKFSCSAHRSGKSSISWEKVQSWFEDKETTVASKYVSSSAGNEPIRSKSAVTRDKAKASTISASEAAALLPNLVFEARSAKDYAWFDVAAFLNYKVLSSGELVVRVRFAGFGKDEDEWVSVTSAVRERSIPLEHSECNKVNVGDVVLSYKETEDYALYCDARIVDIERKLHNGDACTCIFTVRYSYSSNEEKVTVDKLCCRPGDLVPEESEDCKPVLLESDGLQKVM